MINAYMYLIKSLEQICELCPFIKIKIMINFSDLEKHAKYKILTIKISWYIC
jgi:hypothetical protein